MQLLIFNIVVVFTLIVFIVGWKAYTDANRCKKLSENLCDPSIVSMAKVIICNELSFFIKCISFLKNKTNSNDYI